jgi:uncharacterized protein (TIGR03067 family)
MRKTGTLAIVLVFAGVGLLSAGDDAIKKAMKEAEGTWKIDSRVQDGKKVPDEDLKDLGLVLKGNTWTVSRGGEVLAEGTYKIVAAEKKMQKIDAAVKGKTDEKPIKGIFKVDGDTLTVCFAGRDKDRPTAFESRPESGAQLTVYKRVKR